MCGKWGVVWGHWCEVCGWCGEWQGAPPETPSEVDAEGDVATEVPKRRSKILEW